MTPVALFDLDGTLLDTQQDVLSSIDLALAEAGLRTNASEVPPSSINQGGVKVLRCALQAQGITPSQESISRLLPRFLTHYSRLPQHTSTYFSGIERALQRLRAAGVKLGIVTNKISYLTHPLAEHHRLYRLFRVIVSGDTCIRRKPHAEPLLHAINVLGGEAARAVMVGDAIGDQRAATAAGTKFIAADYGFANDELKGCEAYAHASQGDQVAELVASALQL